MLFKYFPEIQYDDHIIRDISRHASFVDTPLDDPYIYLPYTLRDGEKPEDVSFLYYGTVKYTPYVLMANGVVDPYVDWLMPEDVLHSYIIKKYKEASGMKGNDVLRWAASHQRFDNIVEWRTADDLVKSMDTYIDDFVPENEKGSYYDTLSDKTYQPFSNDWFPIRVYDWEIEKNEEKRAIRLIDRNLIAGVHEQYVRLIRD